MSDISDQVAMAFMIDGCDKYDEATNTRIDCALGIELKQMRIANNLTLMTMSEALGWEPVKLSKYEQNVGALTDPDDARLIEAYCGRKLFRWQLSDTAINLSNKAVKIDLTKTKAMLARWRLGDFGNSDAK